MSTSAATFSLSTATVRRQPSWLTIMIVGVILATACIYRTAGWSQAGQRTGPLEMQILFRIGLSLLGLVLWASLSKAYANAFGRQTSISWWRLAEVYLVTSLVMTPHAMWDGLSFFNQLEPLPWPPLFDKAAHLILFWVLVVRLAAHARRDGRRP